MAIADMIFLPATTDGKCHIYPGGSKVLDRSHLQRSIDREILAELKEIRRLLEAAIDENFHIVQNDR